MKIKFDDKDAIKSLKGKDFKDADGSIITMRSACVDALLANPPDDRASGSEKVRRFELAQKLNNMKETEFNINAEDISLIKSMAGKTFVTIVVGRMFAALEQKD